MLVYMASSNVPLYLPAELQAEIRQISKTFGIPQSQCMRLSIQYGLPELQNRLGNSKPKRQLPKRASKPWSRKAFANIDLDEPVIEIEGLNETIL